MPEFARDTSNPPGDPDAPEEVDTLKARTAKGSLGPEKQKGFGQGA